MRLLIAGGGTGGHIYPALSILGGFKAKFPGAEVLYVGTREGLEAGLVPREGIPFRTITARGVMGKSPLAAARGVFDAFRGLAESIRLVREFRPDVAVGTGGYVTGPVILAAKACGVSCAIQEQNVIPGMTNRLLGRLVDRVFLPFEEARAYFPDSPKVSVPGNPLRPEILEAGRQASRDELGIRPGDRVVYVFGGSRGAASIHRAMVETLPRLSRLKGLVVFYVTGQAHYQEVTGALGASGWSPAGHPGVRISPYLYRAGPVLAAADLVICRAGAMTLSEITALGLPAVIVPSPNVANNHQEHNARVLEKAGASVVIKDSDLNGPALADLVLELLGDPDRLGQMAQASRSLGRPRALDEIVETLSAMAGRGVG